MDTVKKARKLTGPVTPMNLNKRWCCMCREDKPASGSIKRGGMYVCADCQLGLVIKQSKGPANPYD